MSMEMNLVCDLNFERNNFKRERELTFFKCDRMRNLALE